MYKKYKFSDRVHGKNDNVFKSIYVCKHIYVNTSFVIITIYWLFKSLHNIFLEKNCKNYLLSWTIVSQTIFW